MKDTLGNQQWLIDNEKSLKDMLPKTWTHMHNLNPVQIGYKLKLLGIDWRSDQDFGSVMVYLWRVGFMLRKDKYLIKAAPLVEVGK